MRCLPIELKLFISLVDANTTWVFQLINLWNLYHIYPMFVEGQSHRKWIEIMATMMRSIHPVPQPQMASSKLIHVYSCVQKETATAVLEKPRSSSTLQFGAQLVPSTPKLVGGDWNMTT